jgi:hypothetical protein
LGDVLRNNTCERNEGSRLGYIQKLNCRILKAETSAHLKGRSEAGMAFQNCHKRQGCLHPMPCQSAYWMKDDSEMRDVDEAAHPRTVPTVTQL